MSPAIEQFRRNLHRHVELWVVPKDMDRINVGRFRTMCVEPAEGRDAVIADTCIPNLELGVHGTEVGPLKACSREIDIRERGS